MKSRIFTSLSAIAVLTALLAPISVAQDTTTPVEKAKPDRTAPPSAMKEAMASEDPSKQPPSCAASVNASKESEADDLIAENRLYDPLFRGEQSPYNSCGLRYTCSSITHVRECSVCSSRACAEHALPRKCWDTLYHRYCYLCWGF